MTSVETTRAAETPQRPSLATPQNSAPRRVRSTPQTFFGTTNSAAETAERSSPDPLHGTDRYRLNMPYLDRID